MNWYKGILDQRFIDTETKITLTVEELPDIQSRTQYLKDVQENARKKIRALKPKKKWLMGFK